MASIRMIPQNRETLSRLPGAARASLPRVCWYRRYCSPDSNTESLCVDDESAYDVSANLNPISAERLKKRVSVPNNGASLDVDRLLQWVPTAVIDHTGEL